MHYYKRLQHDADNPKTSKVQKSHFNELNISIRPKLDLLNKNIKFRTSSKLSLKI